jgi:Trehalose utilisation
MRMAHAMQSAVRTHRRTATMRTQRSALLLAVVGSAAFMACDVGVGGHPPTGAPDGSIATDASPDATPPIDAPPPGPFHVLAFYTGTFDPAHVAFVHEALPWFTARAAENNFTFTSTNDWSQLNTANLAQYQVVMFLDDQPPADRRADFESYMRHGGGWFGFHVCAFNTDPASWPWYHNDFLGTGAFVNNTWEPTTTVLHVEDQTHPATLHLPATFTSAVSEWYSWAHDLRTNPDIRVLAAVDPVSFPLGTDPNQSWYDGYYPILWTNRGYRMLYANFGHDGMNYQTNTATSSTFASDMQDRFILDGLHWLGTGEAGQ